MEFSRVNRKPQSFACGRIGGGGETNVNLGGESGILWSNVGLWPQLPPDRLPSYGILMTSLLFPSGIILSFLQMPPYMHFEKPMEVEPLWFYDNEAFDILIDGSIVSQAF